MTSLVATAVRRPGAQRLPLFLARNGHLSIADTPAGIAAISSSASMMAGWTPSVGPVMTIQKHHKSTLSAPSTSSSTSNVPELVHIPSLPVVGSFFLPYSGLPMKHDQQTIHSFWPALRRKYGDFYSMGMPGLGNGLNGTIHVIQDPNEYAKLLRREGSYPAGSAEYVWAVRRYMDEHNISAGNIIKRGPEWKRIRTFLQTDLLSPASAQRYLPAAMEAAESISRGAPHFSNRMNDYLNIASFDMFSNIMMGTLPRVADPSIETDPEDEKFCKSVATALRLNSRLMTNLYDTVMVTVFQRETKRYKEFWQHFDDACQFADKKVQLLKENREKGLLTKAQEGCYANQAFERQAAQALDEKADPAMKVTELEAQQLVVALLSAGVDTTGGLLSWKMLHLAAHPDVQERLYEEISKTTDADGKLTEQSVAQATAPYLHAFMRESHRLGNAAPMVPIKKFTEPVEVHGVTLEANSVVCLDGLSQQLDPELVEDPMEFRPERFLKDAVMARKGTPSEVIDHAFFSGPFSQGARKCPGSRVASMEACVFIAQLVLDWQCNIPSITHWSQVPYDLDTVTTAQLPPIEFSPRSK